MEENIIVLGTGSVSRDFFSKIDKNTHIVAVLDNDIQKQGTFFFGYKIYPPSEIPNLNYDKVIIAMDTKSDIEKESAAMVQMQLMELGVPDRKITYLPNSYIESDCHILFYAKDYLFERCSNRKLLIYGTGTEAKALNNLFSICNIPIEYFLDEEISDNLFEEKNVKHWTDIAYEKLDNLFIIIANEKECYEVSRQKFLQLGLSEHIGFTYYKKIPGNKEPSNYDVTLSYNRIRNQSGYKQVIEGFELFGEIDNPKALKIVALGGSSTESSLFFIKGWARYLTERFIENGISVVMYCGGVSGYTSSQELLKLIRDVIPLKPDVILSYGGVNDLDQYPHKPQKLKLNEINSFLPLVLNCSPERNKRPFITNFQINYINQILLKFPKETQKIYYGLQNDKTCSELWLDNTRMMHAIAKEYNILFLSFLQPFLYVGNYEITDSQKIIFNRYRPEFTNSDYKNNYVYLNDASEMQKSIKGIDYITDLTNIFSGKANIYLDIVHVTDRGNEIIAEHIFDVLTKQLEKKQ